MEQRETMQLHIAACQASGQTVAAYCSSHGLKPHQYYYWQKRLQQPGTGKFISVAVPVAGTPVLVTFTNGNRISFETLPPVAYLKHLLQ